MNLEERHEKINAMIMNMANNNKNITKEQITKARNLYLNDSRPLESIEQELTQYSEDVRKASPAQVAIDEAFATEEKVDAATNEEIFPIEVAEVKETIRIEDLNTPEKNELDSMFAEDVNEQSLGQQATATKTDAKVFTKKLNENNNPVIEKEEGGYTTINSLLTIAMLLSIMGLIISTLILVTK